MKNMMKRLKSRKGGFTLVELIVVLVILAILAALLIPALTGYIDKAKEKQVIAECRQAVMAAQTIADEQYGKNDSIDTTKFCASYSSEIASLAEVDKANIKAITVTASGKITELTYSNGKTCSYMQVGTTSTYTYSVVSN